LPVVTDPPTEQEMSFLKFIDGTGQKADFVDPLSDDGLRLQALYIQNFSQHPMDVMRRIMENVFSDPKDRLNAAKSLMEYSMRKPTANMEVKVAGALVTVDPAKLSALSTEELEALEKILDKVNG
jgi:hypothetical protein